MVTIKQKLGLQQLPNYPRQHLLEQARAKLMRNEEVDELIKPQNKVNKVVSRSLWLASQIEMSLDNKNKAQKLLAQLKRDFPDSIEAKGNSLVLDK